MPPSKLLLNSLQRSRFRLLWPLVLGLCFCLASICHAERIKLQSIEASYSERRVQGLPLVIDGNDASRIGWSVFPRTNESHSLIVRTAQPVKAQAFELTLCFLTGLPKRYFGEFELSYTTDPQPSLNGQWLRLPPVRFSAAGTELSLAPNGHLVAGNSDNMIADAILQIRGEAPLQAVTGFRIQVFPFERPDAPGLRVAWNEYRDFCLTEFRAEAILSTTTNVALGCAVKASHAPWAGMSPGVLTDGLPGSFNHPADPTLGSAFFFEIDLGTSRRIDHILLRGRADGYGMDRLSKVSVSLYEKAPDAGGTPVWQTMARADGSYPQAGEVDVVRPDPSAGVPKGRYLRLSSHSPIALSPQIAEVEVYETVTPRVIAFRTGSETLAFESEVRVPPGATTLTATMRIEGLGLPERLPIQWRLKGLHDDWQITTDGTAEVNQPPPGKYRFEAQVGHSDGRFDASLLSVPIVVRAHFWKTPAFYWSISAIAAMAAYGVIWYVHRRREQARIAAMEYQSALALERTRIARDMHDEVGARLSQLAIMQDRIVRQHPMSQEAQNSLRELAVNTRLAVDSLDHVVWAVNPLNDTLSGVAEYLSYTASSYLAPLNIECRLDVPFDWPEIEVRAQLRHQLILAFREALQNVAKHSQATYVTLLVRYEAPVLRICLTDNGVGLPISAEGPGKDGLQNMKARLESIGGSCEIRRGPLGGTEVEMRSPVLSPL